MEKGRRGISYSAVDIGWTQMKLRITHLLTHTDDPREIRSIAEVAGLAELMGAEYVQLINPVYEGELPPARECNDRPFELSRSHFGCFQAHKDAIAQYLRDDSDALLICECDCVFTMPLDEVAARIERAYKACVVHDLIAFTLGPKHGGKTVTDLGDWMVTTTRLIETHCLLIPLSAKQRVQELFSLPWDAADYVWTVYGWDQGRHRIGIFDDKIISVQGDGLSLVDGRMKNTENYFRAVPNQN